MTDAKNRKRTFPDAEIAARLNAELPKWTYSGGQIVRKFKTHGWKGTLMVVNAVGHLAEAAWHHPDIRASYSSVEVRLNSHDVKGITERDFALARKIEDVVMWQPGKEGGALEGTPNDPRWAYIDYGA